LICECQGTVMSKSRQDESMDNKIELIGSWGNPPHHAIPRGGQSIDNQNKYLLRECPDCGREKLRYRQRVCDDCRLKRRRKTKRESYYKRKQSM
jgi:ribosomal protein L37E